MNYFRCYSAFRLGTVSGLSYDDDCREHEVRNNCPFSLLWFVNLEDNLCKQITCIMNNVTMHVSKGDRSSNVRNFFVFFWPSSLLSFSLFCDGDGVDIQKRKANKKYGAQK